MNKKQPATPALPAPIQKSDLIRPKYDATGEDKQAHDGAYGTYGNPLEFELWYTERFGWCIPTLLIGSASARNRRGSGPAIQDRTYAVAVKDHQMCRMGMGPHVLATVHVYVTVGRLNALQPFLDLRNKGLASAGDTRDRISTRRAQTSARRNGYNGYPGGW